ncbi:MAG TPA: ABC transporter ATP-binding protein [Gemmatimonadales bacterium]|jgi:subfamily B ATP-binding cassette protein MsbA
MAETEKRKISAKTAWRDAREIMWRHRRRLAMGLAIMIVNRLAGLVLPGSSKFLVDNVIGDGRTDLLLPLAAVVGGATVVQAGSSFALSQILGVQAQRAITEMRKTVQAHVTRLPTRYFDSTKSGILISRIMTDAEGIRNLVGTGLVRFVGGMVTASIGLFVLFALNWQLTALTLVVLGVFGGGMAIAFNKLRPLFRERGRLNAEVTGRLGESLGGIRVVKAYTAERSERLVFARGAHRLFRNVAGAVTGVSAIGAFATLVMGAVGVLIILMGGQAIAAGSMTLGDFVMYIFFAGLVAAPLVSIAEIGTQVSEAFAGLDRIHELQRETSEDDDDADRDAVGPARGEIAFEDVSFEYIEGVPVLKHISFVAPPGTTTALVGSSGSGKSTLISLVMAFNRPKSGRVLLDGKDLEHLKLRDYRSLLGVVLQENFLFDGTINENIAFAKPHATPQEIHDAARVANADEFIRGFEHGYDTVIGERGVKLSGGQRQRISIARAILADPAILILDEATSSLDSESEAMIQEGFRTLRTGRTTFVIAHRLSTIRSADQILVVEGGEIVERGTHVELLLQGGRYRELYNRQYQLEHNLFINPGEDPTALEQEPDTAAVTRTVSPRNL